MPIYGVGCEGAEGWGGIELGGTDLEGARGRMVVENWGPSVEGFGGLGLECQEWGILGRGGRGMNDFHCCAEMLEEFVWLNWEVIYGYGKGGRQPSGIIMSILGFPSQFTE